MANSNPMTDTNHPKVKPASVKVEIEGPYWLTRNRFMGVLSDKVEVWLSKPDLRRFEDGDVMWLPNLKTVDSEDSYYADWTVEKCLKECHVYPETERECIKVG
jgi:hypothetical protein